MINNFQRLGAPTECLLYDPPKVSEATINGRVLAEILKNEKIFFRFLYDSKPFQIQLDLKYLSKGSDDKFVDLASEWTIFVHEKDQIAWDYSNLFGSSYLAFLDSHIPMYNESFSIFTLYTILYNDVTLLNKEDRPCTDEPGYFAIGCNNSTLMN